MVKFAKLSATLLALLTLCTNFIGITTIKKLIDHKPKLIVSVTSFPNRFSKLAESLKTIKEQSVQPDKLILYLSRQECLNGVPEEIKNSVEVHYVEDVLNKHSDKINWDGQIIRSYGKLIPALLEYPDDIIITFDDRFYNNNCIEYLTETHKKYPRDIINLGGRNLDFSQIDNQYGEEYYLFEGGSGLLYPPHCFKDKDIFDINLATTKFETNDDVFFWRCALLNNVKTINPFGRLCWNLFKYNMDENFRHLSETNSQNNWQLPKDCIKKAFWLNPKLRKLFNFPENGTYEIVSELDANKVLTIAGESKKQCARLQLWERNNISEQQFNVVYDKNGYYTIEAKCSGKVIDVPAARKKPGTALWQYTSNGTDAQKWYIMPCGHDSFVIISKCNGLLMDVLHSGTTDGTSIQCFESNDTNAQKFKFKKISYEVKSETAT